MFNSLLKLRDSIDGENSRNTLNIQNQKNHFPKISDSTKDLNKIASSFKSSHFTLTPFENSRIISYKLEQNDQYSYHSKCIKDQNHIETKRFGNYPITNKINLHFDFHQKKYDSHKINNQNFKKQEIDLLNNPIDSTNDLLHTDTNFGKVKKELELFYVTKIKTNTKILKKKANFLVLLQKLINVYLCSISKRLNFFNQFYQKIKVDFDKIQHCLTPIDKEYVNNVDSAQTIDSLQKILKEIIQNIDSFNTQINLKTINSINKSLYKINKSINRNESDYTLNHLSQLENQIITYSETNQESSIKSKSSEDKMISNKSKTSKINLCSLHELNDTDSTHSNKISQNQLNLKSLISKKLEKKIKSLTQNNKNCCDQKIRKSPQKISFSETSLFQNQSKIKFQITKSMIFSELDQIKYAINFENSVSELKQVLTSPRHYPAFTLKLIHYFKEKISKYNSLVKTLSSDKGIYFSLDFYTFEITRRTLQKKYDHQGEKDF